MVVFIAATLAAVYVVENRRGEKAWKRYTETAEKRGDHLLPAVERPAISDGDNFAAEPIFAELFSEDAETRERAAARFRLPAGMARPRPPNVSTGRWFPLNEWREALVAAQWVPSASDDPAGDVLAALDRFAPVLAGLRAAESRPAQQFRRLPAGNGWPVYPELHLITDLARLLQLRAAARLAHGESEEAARDITSLLRLYAALRDDDCLISGIVRTSLLALVCHTVWEGLAGEKWSEEQLRSLEGRLAEVRLADDFKQAFVTERQVMNSYYEMLIKASIAERRRLSALGDDSLFPPVEDDVLIEALNRWGPIWMPRGWFRQNQVRANRSVDEILKNFGQRDGELHQRKFGSPTPLRIEGPRPYRFMHSRTSVSVYKTVTNIYLRTQTLLQQARLACALERYRRDQGSLPLTLEQLVPGYVARLPRDVIDGAPLRYRREDEGGFVLYSVALDARDDGGMPEDEKHSGTRAVDWLWRSRWAAAH